MRLKHELTPPTKNRGKGLTEIGNSQIRSCAFLVNSRGNCRVAGPAPSRYLYSTLSTTCIRIVDWSKQDVLIRYVLGRILNGPESLLTEICSRFARRWSLLLAPPTTSIPRNNHRQQSINVELIQDGRHFLSSSSTATMGAGHQQSADCEAKKCRYPGPSWIHSDCKWKQGKLR